MAATKEKSTKPGYTSESYASKFAPDRSIYQDDSRIFHRYGYAYETASKLVSVSAGERKFSAVTVSRSGRRASLALIPYAPGILRLKMYTGKTAFDDASPMLSSGPVPSVRFKTKAVDGGVVLSFGGYTIQVRKDPFAFRITDTSGAVLFMLETERLAGQHTAAPLGYRTAGNTQEPYFSFRIRNDERFFGLGEKWNKVEKSSTRATIWASDTCGSNTTDMSYKSLPLLFSSFGWGAMLHSSFRSKWEVGTFSYTAGSALTEDPKLDLFIFLSPTLKGLIERYTWLTGRPAMPPRWAMGLWMSRCMYQNRGETDEVVTRLRKEKIPCDVIHLDPKWMKVHWYYKIGVDACDFDRNDEGFPDLPGLFKEYREKGFATDLWINPYIPEGTPVYDVAKRKGYLLKSTKGGIARLEHGNPVGMIDFTNPQARAWWKGFLVQLARDGAMSFKPDYGDRVPEDALFHNGRTGKELHNLYLHFFSETAFEAIKEVYGEGITFRRAGYIGTQRYPGTWAGDTQVTWEGLKGCFRGGLNAGLSGEAFWTADIGGFTGVKPSEELYCRWSQFGLLSPLSRYHGNKPREPWHYGDTAMKVVKKYARLRYSLMPYLFAIARESCDSGVPMMRHTCLEFPRDPGAENIDDQYLLGPDLLVAPVFNPGQTSRSAYLPSGTWYAFEDPLTAIPGGRYITAKAPIGSVPLFVRGGAVIPRYREALQHLKGALPRELHLDIYPGDSRRSLVVDEGKRKVKINYVCKNGKAILICSGKSVVITTTCVGWKPDRFLLNAKARKEIEL